MIPHTNMLQAWVRFEDVLMPAIDRAGGTHHPRDVLDGLMSGDYQLWTYGDSAVVTEIYEYPRKKVCHIFLAGGNMQDIRELHVMIEEWAKEKGCSSLSLAGRKGWARSFLTSDQDWSIDLVLMSKDL